MRLNATDNELMSLAKMLDDAQSDDRLIGQAEMVDKQYIQSFDTESNLKSVQCQYSAYALTQMYADE